MNVLDSIDSSIFQNINVLDNIESSTFQNMNVLDPTISSTFQNMKELDSTDSSTFIHSIFCLTTGPKPPPKRCLHLVRCRASSFK